MLLKANHEESDKFISKGQLVELKRGQFVTSINEMMKAFRWSQNRVYRFMDMLEQEQMIVRNGQPNGTTITIVNYGLYQGGQIANGQSDGQPNEQANGQPDGQSDGQLSRSIKNDKECKEGEEASRQQQRTPEEEEAIMARWREQMKERCRQ